MDEWMDGSWCVGANNLCVKQVVSKEERTHRRDSILYPKLGAHRWSKRIIQEICAFLILANIMVRKRENYNYIHYFYNLYFYLYYYYMKILH